MPNVGLLETFVFLFSYLFRFPCNSRLPFLLYRNTQLKTCSLWKVSTDSLETLILKRAFKALFFKRLCMVGFTRFIWLNSLSCEALEMGAHQHILIINNSGLHCGFSSWSFKILGQNLRISTLIILKYLRLYCTMDKKLSVISSSVIGSKTSISWYRLNISINHDSCRSQASYSDSSLPGLLQKLQLRRQATSSRTRSPWSELTFMSNLFWPSNRLPYHCSKQEMILSTIYAAWSRK